jgi:hypothetical protein
MERTGAILIVKIIRITDAAHALTLLEDSRVKVRNFALTEGRLQTAR